MEYKEGTHCLFMGAYGKIYSLSDRNGNVFYIGCTVMPLEQRLRAHISEAKSNSPFGNKKKIKIISESNFEITATILQISWVTGRGRYEAHRKLRPLESEWIQKYITLGYDLCNREAKQRLPKNNHIKEQVGMSITISKDKISVEETESIRA